MAEEKSVLQLDSTIESPNGQVNGKINLLNEEGNPVFSSVGFRLVGDIYILTGATAPVDYTDGDPAATGEGVAAKGSLYMAQDTGKWYTNKGTKAQPVWGIFTSA